MFAQQALHILPLRERTQDILPLARHFLAAMAGAMGRGGMQFSADAEQAILQYPWPGNARELENVVQRAVILAGGEIVLPQHLHLQGARTAVAVTEAETPSAAGGANQLKLLEKEHIMNVLASVNGSRTLAAQKLGMSERTLRHKLQQYREGK